MKKIVKYFFRGLLYTVPITVTGAFVVWAFNKIDQIIPNIFPEIKTVPGLFPGVGVLIIIISIILIGFIGSLIISSPINRFFKHLLKQAPLLETIYTSVKDLMGTFIGNKKGFKKAVFVKLFDNSNIERIGFISNDDLKSLNINEGRVLVYIPHSYNFSGNLFVVEKKYITPIDAPSSEVMKLIVSGGITNINKK